MSLAFAEAGADLLLADLNEQGAQETAGVGGTFCNVVRIQPPLTLTADEAHWICDVVEGCVEVGSR